MNFERRFPTSAGVDTVVALAFKGFLACVNGLGIADLDVAAEDMVSNVMPDKQLENFLSIKVSR